MNYHSAANPAGEWERIKDPSAAGWLDKGLQAVEACADAQETDAFWRP